ncbi:MAG: dTDP-4-dehydrorhamnose reductase [Candidatus Binatia bacterium]
MIRLAVIGSTGQLGTDLVEVLKEGRDYQVFPLSHAKVECTEPDSVRRELREVRPGVVVNCAAFVRVDECEDRPEEAFRVNALGALYVARACAEIGALCVYVSTDYVFDGEKGEPYNEEDKPRPINVYGASKLAGEHLVQQACPRWLIVRMASLFGKAGSRGKGGNLVETILAKARAGETLRVVNDIRMSPTYTCDTARALERLLQQKATGLFHLANDGTCTWYEFAKKALDLVGLNNKLEPISSIDYLTRAPRPRDSTLRSIKLDPSLKGALRPWDKALRAYLVEKGYLSA